MTLDVLAIRDDAVVRRMILRSGEAMAWHVDPCRRYSVVLGGDQLTIEYRDATASERIPVHRGMAGWDEPEPRVHRAVNSGIETYEELVTFLLPIPGADPQPEQDSP